MQKFEEDDSCFVVEEANIQRETKPPNKYNTEMEGSSPQKNLTSISLNIVGLDKIIRLFIYGFLKLIEMIFKFFLEIFSMLVEHPLVLLLLITFFIGPYLPTAKIEALKELFKSLAALFM